jgi:hypothetical protein
MGDLKLESNAQKRLLKTMEMLKKNDNVRQKHLKTVKEISNKKKSELTKQQKAAENKLQRNRKAILENLDKKSKAFTAAKLSLDKAIAEKDSALAKVNKEYKNAKARINANKAKYNKKYDQVLAPSNNHLFYGRSTKANQKRATMAKFLVKKMYYDPQKNLQTKSAQFLHDHQINVPTYNPEKLAEKYIVGAKGMHNTRKTGKFTLPVNIYNKGGTLKQYKTIAKELMNARPHKPFKMNINNSGDSTKKEIPRTKRSKIAAKNIIAANDDNKTTYTLDFGN